MRRAGERERLLASGMYPVFSVSVASKEVSFPVNALESTLMGIVVSVADKELREIGRVGGLQGLQV